MKKALAIGVSALILVGSAAGFANAATTSTTTSPSALAGCLATNGTLQNVIQSTTPPTCSNGKGIAWGLQGPQGNPGSNGRDGAPGLQGNPGHDGSNGNNGNDGAPGARGNDGAPGAQGPQGAQGPKGDTGDARLGNVAAPTSAVGNFDGKTGHQVAQCAAGQVALSGGFDLSSAKASNWPAVSESRPVKDPNTGIWGWSVTLTVPSQNSTFASMPFNVYVVCS